MKKDDRIEELKKKYFSEGLRNHFEENHKSMQKNIKIFKGLKAPNGSSVAEVSLMMMLSIMGEKIWDAIDTISNEMQISHLASSILRKKVKNLEGTLTQQGKEIDKDRDYDDVLRFLDFYVKRNSDADKEEDNTND